MLFHNEFNKFNSTGAQMLEALNYFKSHFFHLKMVRGGCYCIKIINGLSIFLHGVINYIYPRHNIIWASVREILFLGIPTKQDSNQSPQLQRLARK